MKDKNFISTVLLFTLVSSSLQDKSESKQKSRMVATLYRSMNESRIPLSEGALLNKEGLKEESKILLNSITSYTYKPKGQRLRVSVFISDRRTPKSISSALCPGHRLKMKFPFSPNSTHLKTTLLYTHNNENNDLKVKISSPSKIEKAPKGCKNALQIQAISLSLDYDTKDLNQETTRLSSSPKLKELKLFQIKDDVLEEFSITSFRNSIFIDSAFFSGITLLIAIILIWVLLIFFYVLLVASYSQTTMFDCSYLLFDFSVEKVEKSCFPFFGCTLIQVGNSIAFLIWAIKFASLSLLNIFTIAFLIAPLAVFHLFLAYLAARKIWRCKISFFSIHTAVSVLFMIMRLKFCLDDFELNFNPIFSICLVLILDVFSMKKGTIFFNQMTSFWMWLLFSSYCSLILVQAYGTTFCFNFVGVMEFPESTLDNLLTCFWLILLSFLVFLLKFPKVSHSLTLRNVKKSYSRVAKVSRSKTTSVEAVVYHRGERIFDDSEKLSLNLMGDLKSKILRNKIRFYPFSSSSMPCPNHYLNFKHKERKSILEYYINDKRRWSYQIASDQSHPTHFSTNIWFDSNQLENFILVFRRIQMKICLFNIARRKVMMSFRLPPDGTFNTSSKPVTFIGFSIRSAKRKTKFVLMTQIGCQIALWCQDQKNSYALKKKINLDLSRFSKVVTEQRFRYLANFSEFSPFENLLAVKLMWIDCVDHRRDVINMSKFHTIGVFEVDEDKGTAK